MSYCELLGFKKGECSSIEEFENAHGWTAFVWSGLFTKYVIKKHKTTATCEKCYENEYWQLSTQTARGVVKAVLEARDDQ